MIYNGHTFKNFKPIDEADEDSIVWGTDIQAIRDTKAKLIVCGHIRSVSLLGKIQIFAENPRLKYIEIMNEFIEESWDEGGKQGPGTFVHSMAVIYEDVTIGKDCIIHPYVAIGSPGFGFEQGIKFPHIGGVIIGDNVEIQAMTNVDRGALGNVIIGDNTKIDTQCHVGHNTKIGKNCIICAQSMLGGNTTIGDNVYISPNTVILTRNIHIGDNAFIGTGSLITKDVKAGDRVMGSPAKSIL